MPDKFVSKIITPFGERLIKAAAVTDDVKNALKDIELISFSTTFAQVGEILTAGKLPILVDETIEDSPYYYNFIYDNDGLEYIFSNLFGTINRTYRLSGGGWGVLSSITFEKSSNRVTTWSSTPSNTKYPSEKLVFDSLGMKDNGSKTESDIVNGKFTINGQNSTTKLTLTSVSTLTILSNVGVPNFAITIDNSANASNVSISVKTSDELTTLYHSKANGTSIAAGSILQITAVGDCWTMAEFEV